jgi:hypothetical protein
MNSEALQNLPPEMQARLAQIMTQAQQQPGSPVAPAPMTQEQRAAANFGSNAPAPIVKPPSLMDHLIALRQEVGAMRQEIANMSAQVEANSSVVEAVGQATGTIYQMFQQTSNPNPTYSESFQQQSQVDDGNDY